MIFLYGISYGMPEQIFDIKNFGATGDGIQIETKAIQAAVDKCAENGGKVIIPMGKYLSGTIYLKSNVHIHIEEGAVLYGSTDLDNYPKNDPDIEFYGSTWLDYSLFYAENVDNITLSGRGTIDGQGGSFPIENNEKPFRYMNRPYIFWFVKSKNILVEDLFLTNSALWMQHYLACENVTIRGIRVYNHSNKNNDMIDIDGCRNVTISDCRGDSDDDALTIKSTSDRIRENIMVTNCIFSSHCNAIKCGTESSGGFRNITISNCIIRPSSSPTKIYGEYEGDGGIALELVDGGIMENVSINNIVIDGPQIPLFIRLGNRGRAYKKGMDPIQVGILRDIKISNIIAHSSSSIGCSFTGIPGYYAKNITLSNISISYPGGGTHKHANAKVPEQIVEYPEGNMFGILPAYGLYLRHVENIALRDIDFSFHSEDMRHTVIADDVRGLILSDIKADISNGAASFLKLVGTKDVLLEGIISKTGYGTLVSSGPDNHNIKIVESSVLGFSNDSR